MKATLLLKIFVVSAFIFYLGSTISLAESAYHITGTVSDINGNGVPGAKVTLMNKGLAVLTDSSNPTTTVSSGSNIGSYSFDLSSLMAGDYLITAEKNGKESSTYLTVSSGSSTKNYSGLNIAMRNLAVSTVTPAETAPPAATATPTAAATSTVTATPAANATATATAVASITATPTTEAIASPVPTVTPTAPPTPGFVFTLIPALFVLCLIALRKRN